MHGSRGRRVSVKSTVSRGASLVHGFQNLMNTSFAWPAVSLQKSSESPTTCLAWPGHVLLSANAAPNTRILVAVRVGGLPAAMCAKLVAAKLELVQRLGLHTNRALSISGGRHWTHLVLCGDCAACAARSVVHAEAPFWTRSAANCTQFQGASPAPTGWTYSTCCEGVLSMATHTRFVLDLDVVHFWVRGWDDIITFAMTLLEAIPRARVLQALFGNLRHVGRELCAGSYGANIFWHEFLGANKQRLSLFSYSRRPRSSR